MKKARRIDLPSDERLYESHEQELADNSQHAFCEHLQSCMLGAGEALAHSDWREVHTWRPRRASTTTAAYDSPARAVSILKQRNSNGQCDEQKHLRLPPCLPPRRAKAAGRLQSSQRRLCGTGGESTRPRVRIERCARRKGFPSHVVRHTADESSEAWVSEAQVPFSLESDSPSQSSIYPGAVRVGALTLIPKEVGGQMLPRSLRFP